MTSMDICMYMSDNLWTPYTDPSDKLLTYHTNLDDNRHEDFEGKKK